MISWGETGPDVSVACTGPATFDLANVAIDQTVAVATMTATAAKMIILRISCHPFQRDELMIALAHRPQFQGEGLHTGRFFAIARTYRARRQRWAACAMRLGRLATATSVEAGVAQMLDRMKGGRWKVFRGQNDAFLEECRLYHRKDGLLVKESDDAISASRYALMMLRYARASTWHSDFYGPVKYPKRGIV